MSSLNFSLLILLEDFCWKNNSADTAAKNGFVSTFWMSIEMWKVDTKTTLKCSKRIFLKNKKKQILESAINHWQKKWNFSLGGHQFREVQTEKSLGNSSKCLKSRAAQNVVHQTKIGCT